MRPHEPVFILQGIEVYMAKGKNNKKKKASKIMDIIIPVVLIGIIIFSGVNAFLIYSSYKEAREIYSGLELYVNEEIDEEKALAMEDAGFPYIDVDFQALSAINEDFIGWLYFPLLNISYPVVFDQNDFSYLHMAMDKTPTKNGSIFVDSVGDPNAVPELEDLVTIFYGHNMRDGSMFGSLKKIRQEEGLIDEDPYFYYYTEHTAYKCRVFAYYLDKESGITYGVPKNNKGYDQYMSYILEKNEYEGGPDTVDIAHRPQLVTLSTCSGHNTGNRTVLQAAIVDTYSIDGNVNIDSYFEAEVSE